MFLAMKCLCYIEKEFNSYLVNITLINMKMYIIKILLTKTCLLFVLALYSKTIPLDSKYEHHEKSNFSALFYKSLNANFDFQKKSFLLSVFEFAGHESIFQLERFLFEPLVLLDNIVFSHEKDNIEVWYSGMGKEAKFVDGKISSRTGNNNAINSFQTSIPVQPGNSGGPVFDEKGNLIGIINAKVNQADNVSYAIKLNYVMSLYNLIDEPTPSQKTIETLSLEEKIKELSKYVVLIKIK